MPKHQPKKYFDARGRLIVRPYRVFDLCNIYGVSTRTLQNWIKPHSEEIGERTGKYYSVLQVECMLKRFGRPKFVETSLERKRE